MQRDYISLLLRTGVAFALIYPAVSGFITPNSWIGFFPPFIRDIVGSDDALTYTLHTFGIVEVIVGFWILIGKHIFIPSVIATVMLFLIVVFNIALLDILFRDIPIMLMSMALAFMHWPRSEALTA